MAGSHRRDADSKREGAASPPPLNPGVQALADEDKAVTDTLDAEQAEEASSFFKQAKLGGRLFLNWLWNLNTPITNPGKSMASAYRWGHDTWTSPNEQINKAKGYLAGAISALFTIAFFPLSVLIIGPYKLTSDRQGKQSEGWLIDLILGAALGVAIWSLFPYIAIALQFMAGIPGLGNLAAFFGWQISLVAGGPFGNALAPAGFSFNPVLNTSVSAFLGDSFGIVIGIFVSNLIALVVGATTAHFAEPDPPPSPPDAPEEKPAPTTPSRLTAEENEELRKRTAARVALASVSRPATAGETKTASHALLPPAAATPPPASAVTRLGGAAAAPRVLDDTGAGPRPGSHRPGAPGSRSRGS